MAEIGHFIGVLRAILKVRAGKCEVTLCKVFGVESDRMESGQGRTKRRSAPTKTKTETKTKTKTMGGEAAMASRNNGRNERDRWVNQRAPEEDGGRGWREKTEREGRREKTEGEDGGRGWREKTEGEGWREDV